MIAYGEFVRLDPTQYQASAITAVVIVIVLAALSLWLGSGLGTELYNNWLDRKESQ